DWNTAANWSLSSDSTVHHVPTATELALIDRGAANPVVTYAATGTQPTVGALQNADTLTISGGSPTVAGPAATSGAITISSTGTLTANSNLTASTLNLSGSGTLNGTGTVTVNGAMNWSGGTISTGGAGSTNIATGATLNMTSAGPLTMSAGTLNNAGI